MKKNLYKDYLKKKKIKEKFDGEVAAMFFNHDFIRKMLDDHWLYSLKLFDKIS